MHFGQAPRTGASVSTVAVRVRRNRLDDIFFSGMASVILFSVLIGFSQTFFLAPLPNILVHIHAAVFSCWIILLVVQSSLIAGHRKELHRSLGLLGFGLSCLVVIFGVVISTENLVRNYPGFNPEDHSGVDFKAFYAVTLSDMLMYSTLMFFAFRKRFDPSAHKRLIIIATLAISDAAFDRWPIPVAWWGHRVTPLLCIYPLLLLMALYDWWSLKKIHPVTLWASLFLVLVQQWRFTLGHTQVWQQFATWVYLRMK